MVAVTTRGSAAHAQDDPLFSLIETRGVFSRLAAEFTAAWGQLKRNPREFIAELVTADNKDKKRRRRLYAGLACGVIVHLALLGIVLIAGLRHLARQPEADSEYVVTAPKDLLTLRPEGPSKPPGEPKGDNGKGGGGGGQLDPRPTSFGAPPPMVVSPQIVSPKPSTIERPALPVDTTLVGMPDNHPPEPHPGDPNGKPGEPSGGSGVGGGMGVGEGTGIGPGKGSGAGPGKLANKGGGTPGSPDGDRPGIKEVDWQQVGKIAGFSKVTWIHRPRPVVTPEAQADKVIGTVMLRATFHADGTISDIEVVNRVSYMTESAIESLMRSTFRPATLYGVPITLKRAPVTVKVHY